MDAPVQTRAVAPRLGSGEMFDGIARRYDLLNRLMSLGGDRRWRRHLVAALSLQPGDRIVDLASGTADVALEVLRQQSDARVVGLDPSVAMLDVGRRKVGAAGLADAIQLLEGDAQQIPFPTASFDGATIAFGIRNVPDRARALAEMARVTRPGRRVCVLELGEPPPGLLGSCARVYVHQVVPRLGALISGSREYAYLQQSIAKFPPPEEFARLMAANGLVVERVACFSLGACSLFVGRSIGGETR